MSDWEAAYQSVRKECDRLEAARREIKADRDVWKQAAGAEAQLADEFKAERDRYREALIRCAEVSGEDGEAVEAARSGALKYPPLDVWAVECVQQLRNDYAGRPISDPEETA